MVQRLFPKLSERINLISGESKGRVEGLYAVLARTASQVGVANRFYAIVDRDSDPRTDAPANTHVLKWDVYHIENFLLESHHLLVALNRIAPNHQLDSKFSIVTALKSCAQEIVDELVTVRLRKEVYHLIVSGINLGSSGVSTPARDLMPSITGSFYRLEQARSQVMDVAKLEVKEAEIRRDLEKNIADGTWISEFPGRSLLKRFVHNHCNQEVAYDAFVNLILSSMDEEDFKPQSMKDTLSLVVADP